MRFPPPAEAGGFQRIIPMKSRVFVTIIAILLAVIVLTGACSAGFIAGQVVKPGLSQSAISFLPQITSIAPGNSSAESTATPEDLQKTFEPFWQAWNLLHEEYVDQPLDNQKLMRGAIKGMLDSLGDPHTAYLDPDQYKELNTQLQGEEKYEGIGAWVDTTSDYLTIISPMPKSPAENAGLRTGDKIIAIDGKDMTGIDGEVVRKQVLGPAGSIVTLTILREGVDPFDVKVTRASINVPSLESRMLEDDIGYVHLYVFGDKTREELRATIKELLAQNPKGLILDLRYNGGGYLTTAIDVASEFIDSGTVMYEVYGDGTKKTYEAKRGGLATDIPMVVLINEGSASASEIVAGAIQDRGRGKLVGVTSFGKGSVQVPTALQDDQGAVRITIARWLTPNGRTIHGVGLEPDYNIPITDDDRSAGRDPQLDKAIELLKQQ
jgi:carboxyl-terminal processing protease